MIGNMLYELLSTGLPGVAVCPVVAPDANTPPVLVYQTRDEPIPVFDTPNNDELSTRISQVQLDYYAAGYSAAQAGAKSARELMVGLTSGGQVGSQSVFVQKCRMTYAIDLVEPETGWHRVSMDFELHYNE